MKKILLLLLFANLVAGIMAGGLFYLAYAHPLTPAHSLYTVQIFAENVQISFPRGANSQAELALVQIERRTRDLADAATEQQIELSAGFLHQSLLEGAERIRKARPQEQVGLMNRLARLYEKLAVITSSIPDDFRPASVIFLKNNIGNFLQDEVPQQLAKPEPITVSGVVVPFLNADFEHTHFPLQGAHKEKTCVDCHVEGIYKGIANTCGACHELKDLILVGGVDKNEQAQVSEVLIYPDHFEGDCDNCHHTYSWIPYQFDHQWVTECFSCHQIDTPTVEKQAMEVGFQLLGFLDRREFYHYPGACVTCHKDTESWRTYVFEHEDNSTCEPCHIIQTPGAHYRGACNLCHEDVADWQVITYDHDGVTECESCHNLETPEDHYLKPCSQCHKDVENWNSVVFDHSGYADCESCHWVNRPAEHYPGGCTLCHLVGSWFAITFDHDGYPECQTCHETPANHSQKKCSDCHEPESWKPKRFVHKLDMNCQTCHELPLGHYEKPCSNCHTTTDWSENWFNHTGYTNCTGCHLNSAPLPHYYGFACDLCHGISVWREIVFAHSVNNPCTDCHVPPANHYGVLCENCHNTSSWQNATFDHTGYDYCSGCHEPPAGHWPGQCDKCHGTQSWTKVDFDHTDYTDCKACHTRPDGHDRGQCSKCHNTKDWNDVITPTPYSTPLKSGTPMSTASTNTPGPGVATATPSPTPTSTWTPTPTLTPTSTSTPSPTSTP